MLTVILVSFSLFASAYADFFYTKSVPSCGRSICQKEDYFHFYTCGGDACEFHLQPWVFAVVSFIVLSFLLSLLCSLLTCICCPDRRRR